MSLQTIQVPYILDTTSSDFVAELIEPALCASLMYDRAVGYFSSGWLRINAKGMVAFAANGGKARWVTSAVLDSADFAALDLGDRAKTDYLLHKSLRQNITDLQETLETDTLSALAWMVADGVLTFKIALPTGKLSGDFHDKFGVFGDSEGNRLAFIGSYNESIRGTQNSESISLFPSWQHDALLPYLESIAARFERLWTDCESNVRVYELPEAIREGILQLRTGERPYPIPDWIKVVREQRAEYVIHQPKIPAQITLRDYQEEAITAWFENDCQGLFEMATGTGKTITAIGAAVRLLEREERLAIVISVPYQHLVVQWQREVEEFGFRPILAYRNRQSWLNDLSQEIGAFNGGHRLHLAVITTHTTFSSDHFQAIIERLNTSSLLIADEAHHLGSARSRQSYPQHIPYRLALSATPDRWFDDVGTAALRGYFGRTVFQFTLQQAIGVSLTPYFYHPHLVELTDDEMDEYRTLSAKIARLYASDDPDLQDAHNMLLIKRARLLNNAANKLVKLRELLDGAGRIRQALFYCDPGQIDAAQRIIGWEKGILAARFSAEQTNSERQQLLRDFANGQLEGLVAMKCLDEGVDVPSTRTAYFLASSGNPREFIQRRGRILRNHADKTVAIIHDLIAIPPVSGRGDAGYRSERTIVRRELTRFAEFASVAKNKHEALNVIWELAAHYGLRDLVS